MMSARKEREYLQDERDEFNRKLAIESSWLCDIFQGLNLKEKQNILKKMIHHYKQIKLAIQNGQVNQEG